MFEVGFFTGSKEMIPSGWNVVDEDKTYPSISSRNPQVHQSIDEDSGNGFEDGRAGSESSDEELYRGTSNGFSNTTRKADETSDEDDEVIQPSAPRVSLPSFLRL
jgi:ubiquitin carboxyl-terminal hydrolase 4/11/15